MKFVTRAILSVLFMTYLLSFQNCSNTQFQVPGTDTDLAAEENSFEQSSSSNSSSSFDLDVNTLQSKSTCTGLWNPYLMTCGSDQSGIPLSEIIKATPGANNGEKNIEIHPGEVAYLDQNVNIGNLVINGELHCNNQKDLIEIKARTIYVNGLFQCGNEYEKFQKKLIISLKHNANVNVRSNPSYRALIVNKLGTLKMLAASHQSGIARITTTIDPGAKKISLNKVVNWKVGDEIVIAPTSYDSTQAEAFKILSIQGNPSTLELSAAVKHRHWGKVETYNTQTGAIKLDQRAEVINLNRPIVIRSDESAFTIPSTDTVDAQLGGHVMVHKEGKAYIDSVEFYRMGQAGIMGRYPFHWHLVGNALGQYVINSSIHRSFQRCITIHETNQTLVQNNSCYDFKGHGYFFETGNEVNNVMNGNIGIRAQFPSASKILLASDNPKFSVSRRFPTVSVFWISHPQNTIINNIAAGSVGTGFWMSFPSEIKNFNNSTGEYEGSPIAKPGTANTLRFDNNIAHSTLVGHTWDGGIRLNEKVDNPNNPQDRRIDAVHYDPPQIPVFKNLVAYKNLQAGIYFRGNSAIYENAILADNGWSLFLAYNQIIKKSAIIAKSANFGDFEVDYLYNKRKHLQRSLGILLYDGPFELEQVDFINFSSDKEEYNGVDITSVPFVGDGGSEKFTNRTQKIKFTPEPHHRALLASPYKKNLAVAGWQDTHLVNSIRDLDGSLTGTPNGLLLPNSSFVSHSGCVDKSFNGKPSFHDFKVCPSSTRTATLMILAKDNLLHLPFVARRSDGPTSFHIDDWEVLDLIGDLDKIYYNRKFTMLANPDFQYEVLIKNKTSNGKGLEDLHILTETEFENQLSPVVKIRGYGSVCKMHGASVKKSLSELKAATENSYFSDQNDLYIKLKSTENLSSYLKKGQVGAQESKSQILRIECEKPIENKVIGHIDSVTTNSSGTFINGWACDYGTNNQVNVHFYIKGPAGSGIGVTGGIVAQNNSEAAVAFACGNPNKTGHRFSYKVSPDTLNKYPGEPIYLHGISTSGKSNLLLSNSGKHVLPGTKLDPNRIGKIQGVIDSVTKVNTDYYIRGWACDYGKSNQINLHFYVNNPAGSGIGVDGNIWAVNNSEPAVSQACGDNSGKGHRFNYKIPQNVLLKYKGAKIYLHGISTSGKENSLIGRSGQFTVP